MDNNAAALRARVEELEASIQEEQSLQQRAKAKLAAARAGMFVPAVVPILPGQPQNAPQAPDDAPAKEPKVGLPDKYNSTKGKKAEVYVTQIGLYMLSNPQMFPNNRSKVIFSISYLTGQASKWAQPFTTKLFAGQPVLYLKFATAFQMMYYNTKRKALQQLKQEIGSALHYQQGLKKHVRLVLVIARAHFTALTNLSKLALKINNKINGANHYTGDHNPTSTNPNAMDISAMRGALSSLDKATMMWAGLFFHCGNKGHIARCGALSGTHSIKIKIRDDARFGVQVFFSSM
ncbi:hypothetical protein PTTG_29754 [Puccinia triticina 1-1 BBBD Race 1]|uniref:DUF4939 domain-containing protein n=1 Tax=Puccinia triticina (isolate 1-1 / race 1 (BBBD)) TaxID=630390 RepID=A0A180G2R4_PUCT1|nr:hypothetical protein PTTG_29754 [Puccinia triticina 1-1 BBBD Race 1]